MEILFIWRDFGFINFQMFLKIYSHFEVQIMSLSFYFIVISLCVAVNIDCLLYIVPPHIGTYLIENNLKNKMFSISKSQA